jgi:putative membrane protein
MDMVTAHWSASWVVIAAYLVVAAAHLTGLRQVLAAEADDAVRRELRREAGVFQSGLLVVLLALVSPLGYWTDQYLWVRAMQTLLLTFVGPALIVAGAPWLALQRALRPARSRAAGQDGGRTQKPDDMPSARTPLLLRFPVTTVVVFNVMWVAWQFPALLDAAHDSVAVAIVQHVMYVGVAILFWLQLIGSRPWSPAASPLRRAAFFVATTGVGTVLGMVLVFGNGVLYTVYGGAAHHVMTVLDDQQLAGAVLWMGMLPEMIFGAIAVLMQWLRDEESAELSAGLDRLLTQRKSTWPSRPGIR